MHHLFQVLVLSHDAHSTWISLLSLLNTPETTEDCLEYVGQFNPYLEGPEEILRDLKETMYMVRCAF